MPEDPRRFNLGRHVNAVKGHRAQVEAQSDQPFDAEFQEVLKEQNLELEAYEEGKYVDPKRVFVHNTVADFCSVTNADILRGCLERYWTDPELGGNFNLSCTYKVNQFNQPDWYSTFLFVGDWSRRSYSCIRLAFKRAR